MQALAIQMADRGAGAAMKLAINLPLSQLRERHGELPRDRGVLLYCQVGQRGYYATRFLRQHGVDASNLSGGFTTWKALRGAGLVAERS